MKPTRTLLTALLLAPLVRLCAAGQCFGSFRILKKKVGSSLLHYPTCVQRILAVHRPRAFG